MLRGAVNLRNSMGKHLVRLPNKLLVLWWRALAISADIVKVTLLVTLLITLRPTCFSLTPKHPTLQAHPKSRGHAEGGALGILNPTDPALPVRNGVLNPKPYRF